MRFWLLGASGLFSLTLAGCDADQIQVVPVSPPGAVIPRTASGEDVAEAQGESLSASARNASRSDADQLANPTPVGQSITLEGGLNYQTVKEGAGEQLKPGRVGVLNYQGTLDDGTVFASNKKGTPGEFSFGTGRLIKGWEMAVPGMKVGEIRKLTIPPALGYKDKDDREGIPPNSTLHYEVELVGVK